MTPGKLIASWGLSALFGCALLAQSPDADKPSAIHFRSSTRPAKPAQQQTPRVPVQQVSDSAADTPIQADPADHDPIQTGLACYYGKPPQDPVDGVPVPQAPVHLNAAHRAFPFGSQVRVTNLGNGKSVVVTITDRGPFVAGRIISVNRSAAQELGFLSSGTTQVKIELIGNTPQINQAGL